MEKAKILIITGQTGTGKTGFATDFAHTHNGALISADSRQIYKEFDIGTGKVDKKGDLLEQNGVHMLQGIQIFGVDEINAAEKFSAGQFIENTHGYIEAIASSGKLPILVGGTGFYIRSLIEPPETLAIPADEELRERLVQKSTPELQDELSTINPDRLEKMNNSDKNNPHRIVRAIEVELWNRNNGASPVVTHEPVSYAGVILHASKEYLSKKITQRVNEMFSNGYKEEVQALHKKYAWNTPGMETIGYFEWEEFFENKITEQQLKENIISDHIHYAQRQLTFLKHLRGLEWFNVEEENWKEKATEYCKNCIKNIP